jgi:hypothetical protein
MQMRLRRAIATHLYTRNTMSRALGTFKFFKILGEYTCDHKRCNGPDNLVQSNLDIMTLQGRGRYIEFKGGSLP